MQAFCNLSLRVLRPTTEQKGTAEPSRFAKPKQKNAPSRSREVDSRWTAYSFFSFLLYHFPWLGKCRCDNECDIGALMRRPSPLITDSLVVSGALLNNVEITPSLPIVASCPSLSVLVSLWRRGRPQRHARSTQQIYGPPPACYAIGPGRL